MDAVIYIHGKGGNAAEAKHYNLLFSSCNVIGLEYKSFTPWEAGMEIHAAIAELDDAFETFGGVSDEIVTNNMKTVMDEVRTECFTVYDKGRSISICKRT